MELYERFPICENKSTRNSNQSAGLMENNLNGMKWRRENNWNKHIWIWVWVVLKMGTVIFQWIWVILQSHNYLISRKRRRRKKETESMWKKSNMYKYFFLVRQNVVQGKRIFLFVEFYQLMSKATMGSAFCHRKIIQIQW